MGNTIPPPTAPSSTPLSQPQRLAESSQPPLELPQRYSAKYRAGEHHESYRERIEEFEGLGVLASVLVSNWTGCPRSATVTSTPVPAVSRRVLGFNRYTLEHFRDFIDANHSILALAYRAIGAFLLVIVFFTLALLLPISSNDGSRPLPPRLLYLYQRGDRYGSNHRLHSPAVVEPSGRP